MIATKIRHNSREGKFVCYANIKASIDVGLVITLLAWVASQHFMLVLITR